MGKRRKPMDDGAASDLVGNILLVVVSLALGTAVLTIVANDLSREAPVSVSASLTPVGAGDGTLHVLMQGGVPTPSANLKLMLSRNASPLATLATSTWSSTGGAQVRPGDVINVTLSPTLAASESVRLVIVRADANTLVMDATSTAPAASSGLPATNVTLSLSRASVPADGATPATLTARVRNPAGALAVSSVIADTSSLYSAGSGQSFALRDDGAAPDPTGGDADWSGTLVIAPGVTAGVYPINVTAYDTSGARSGTATLNVTVTPIVLGNFTGNFTGNFSGNTSGTFAGNATGNFFGNATGNLTQLIIGGTRSYEGSRFNIPNSTTISSFRLRNFTFDQKHLNLLTGDFILIHVVSDPSQQWTAYLTLAYSNNVAQAVALDIWSNTRETHYVPLNTTLPLTGLDMDLLHPTASQQWKIANQNGDDADGLAYYQNSSINGTASLLFAGMRDSTSNKALDSAIIAVDVSTS